MSEPADAETYRSNSICADHQVGSGFCAISKGDVHTVLPQILDGQHMLVEIDDAGRHLSDQRLLQPRPPHSSGLVLARELGRA